MRILQLAPQIPYPLSDGGKVGIFNITRSLARRGHQITLLAFERERGVDTRPLQEFCDIHAVSHSNKNSVLDALMNLFSEIPYNMSKYRSRAYERSLKALLSSRTFDVVHVDHLHMAEFGLQCKTLAHLPVVLREHNVESVIIDRYASTVRSALLRRWLLDQKRRLRAYEAYHASRVDLCCVITEADRVRLAELAPKARITVVPAGVDAAFFEGEPPDNQIPYSVSMFGSFDWIPNQDALQWFIERIFPRIVTKQPRAKLYIVGKKIPRRIAQHADDRIVVRGFADELRQELQRYEVTVVPLRIGGGMRLKILESFAMHLPVVSTSIGCEGIAVQHGAHLMIGDSEDEIANHVLRLFDDRALRSSLARKAYALAFERYRWERVAEQLEAAYLEAIRTQENGA